MAARPATIRQTPLGSGSAGVCFLSAVPTTGHVPPVVNGAHQNRDVLKSCRFLLCPLLSGLTVALEHVLSSVAGRRD